MKHAVTSTSIKHKQEASMSEAVYDLRSSKPKKAKCTNCKLVFISRSQFFHNRRFFSSHAKLRSTTQRLGSKRLAVAS